WDLVCEKNHLPHLIFTLSSIGGAIGTPLYGALSDRIGRKTTFYISVTVNLVAGVISLVVPSFTAFAVFRLFHGTMFPEIFCGSYILVTENVGQEKRTHILGIASIGWTISMCSLPLIAFVCRDWRILGFITTSFCIPFFFYWRFLPESPRWLVSVERYEEAAVILTRIAKTNKYPVPTDLLFKLKEIGKKREKRHNITSFFSHRKLRKHFLIVTFIWARFDNDFVFQNDKSTAHSACIVQDYLDQEDITRLLWAAKSPHFNPIEKCWVELSQEIASSPCEGSGKPSSWCVRCIVESEEEWYALDSLKTEAHAIEITLQGYYQDARLSDSA
ncbi:solute carrier family 22 member 1-like, partial [Limulus polyphemus]|uniref:Solute carrier family 22 member 1-like n=1 Tax=Limulus polyphemus TaxID=6850 RepID=A0ABM1RUB6_LIMPO